MSQLRAPSLIVISVLFGLAATVLWRSGLIHIGGFALGQGALGQLKDFVTTWQFWGGLAALLVVVVITLDLYSSEDLSRVVPMYSISYVAIAAVGKLWLGEEVGTERWIGIALIVAGVVFLVRS